MKRKNQYRKIKRNWSPRCSNCQRTGFEFIGLALETHGKRVYRCTCCQHTFQYGYDGGPYQEWIERHRK